jgi:hypothetical protein
MMALVTYFNAVPFVMQAFFKHYGLVLTRNEIVNFDLFDKELRLQKRGRRFASASKISTDNNNNKKH